jgi:hypothetical protein
MDAMDGAPAGVESSLTSTEPDYFRSPLAQRETHAGVIGEVETTSEAGQGVSPDSTLVPSINIATGADRSLNTAGGHPGCTFWLITGSVIPLLRSILVADFL